MLKPNQLPNSITSVTPEYPYGKVKDESYKGANDGTPIRQDWTQNLWSGSLEVLDRAGIVPNGAADTATSNQFADAIEALIDDHIGVATIPNSQLATMPTMTLKGNDGGSPLAPQDLTAVEAKTLLGLENVTNQSKAVMLDNAALTGTPTAPTAVATTSTTQVANTVFTHNAILNDTEYLADFRVWDSGRTYAINDPVFHLGIPYRAITSNTNQAPATNPDDWEVVGGAGGGSKNFVKNPLTKNNVLNVTTTGATGAWSASPAIVVDGAYKAITFATGDTIDIDLNVVNASDGGQAWVMEFGYFIATGATYTAGQLVAYLLDGANEIPGGNIPIVLNQVSKTQVFVYPASNLSTLKIRIKCLGGTGDFSIADVRVAPQEIVMTPAVGPEILYTPAVTGITGSYTSTGGWRRVGERMLGWCKLVLTGTPSAIGTLVFYLPSGYTSSKFSEIEPVGVARYGRTGIAQYTGATFISSTIGVSLRKITAPSNQETTFSLTDPLTWQSGDIFQVMWDVPCAQFAGSGTVQVSGEAVEYLSNSSTNWASNDTTSFYYGIEGGPCPNVTLTLAAVEHVAKAKGQISPSDSIDLEISVDRKTWTRLPAALGNTYVQPYQRIPAGDYCGVMIKSIDYTTGAISVAFYKYPNTELVSWSAQQYYWRVVKRSGGSLAQVPPKPRCQYNGSMTIVPTGSDIGFTNLGTKIEDTHNAVTNPTTDWAFVAPMSGVYLVNFLTGANVATSTNTKYVLKYSVNGVSFVTFAYGGVPAGTGGCELSGVLSIRLSAGMALRFAVVAVNNTSGNTNTQKVCIDYLGA